LKKGSGAARKAASAPIAARWEHGFRNAAVIRDINHIGLLSRFVVMKDAPHL
jgi:hypothetical protein